jgi:KaiC/GvpD/RAD55 family RecA-like ATPase
MADLIEYILPKHEVSILAGASGAGKTTLIMQVLCNLQHNEQVFGHAIEEDLNIGYIAADRTWDAYARLAMQVGVDLDRIKVKALIDDTSIDLDQLESNAQGTMYKVLSSLVAEGCDLIVVDPLVVLLGSDINTYHVIAARMIKLNRFCKANQVTILGTHHATKARTDFSFKRPQDRISGSSALLGFTSTQLFLASGEESGQEYTQWHIVSHHAKAEVINLERDKNTGLFVPVDFTTGVVEKQNEIYEEIFKMLPANGDPLAKKVIVDQLKHIGSARLVDDQLKLASRVGALKFYSGNFYGIAPMSEKEGH